MDSTLSFGLLRSFSSAPSSRDHRERGARLLALAVAGGLSGCFRLFGHLFDVYACEFCDSCFSGVLVACGEEFASMVRVRRKFFGPAGDSIQQMKSNLDLSCCPELRELRGREKSHRTPYKPRRTIGSDVRRSGGERP